MMSWVLLFNAAEVGKKKQKWEKNEWIYKKLMILESEISECPEHKVKSKIENIFVNEKLLEEYSVKIYKINPYFWEHYKEMLTKWMWIHII